MVLNSLNLLMKLAFWNIRGVNRPSKQQELRHFLLKHKVNMMGLVETRVKTQNAGIIGAKLFGHNWGLVNNYQYHPNGRIWLAWNIASINFEVLYLSAQLVTGVVNTGFCTFWLSVVYGFNTRMGRHELWAKLASLSAACSMPWLLLGDFNIVLHDGENKSTTMFDHRSMRDFGDCCQNIQLMDLPYQGMHYTWSNKQFEEARTWCKLDRVIGNCVWFQASWDVQVEFLEPGVSDHSPGLVSFTTPSGNKGNSFKYLNGWSQQDSFQQTIRDCWQKKFRGTKMYCLFQKLKVVKGALRELHKGNYSMISARVNEARDTLFRIQQQLHTQPADCELMQQETTVLQHFLKLQKAELSFSQQRAKIRNVKLNDEGTAYFYAKIKERACRNKITSITYNGATATSDASIGEAFVAYYTSLLGVEQHVESFGQLNMGGAKLADEKHAMLLLPIIDSEIKDALFGIDDDKAPGIDGFSAGFFKSTWSTTGPDIIAAVKDFFLTNKLLRAVNTTVLTLVPKVENPTQVTQVRPIACCTVIYKVISKVLANRLQLVLSDFIGMEQSAFVKGRGIQDNIMLAHLLSKHYERKHISPRVMMKVDIQKAFDSLNWSFLKAALCALNIPPLFADWIYTCISTPSFTISLNGSLYGY
ncbi:hypothetical protein RND81_05G038200 [Saponaria officinalis]|uniref:Reverse transcriptase domain-containing protein n=1 Tax=Saponaria officinalis TaxID=3572 RepID=A0AAW1KU14_SAPOF